jgi:hypothetical protein
MYATSCRARLFLIAASAAVASSAAAQGPTAAECDSILRARAVPAERFVELVITSDRRGGKIPRPFSLALLNRIGNDFSLPSKIAVPIFSLSRFATDTLGRGKSNWGIPDLDISVRLTLDASGFPRRIQPYALTRAPDLDSSFVNAIRRAFADTAWLQSQALAPQIRGDSVVVDVELTVRSVYTKKELASREKRIRNSELAELTISRVVLPHYPDGVPPGLPKDAPEMTYPERQAAAKKTGHVLMHAILDIDSTMVPSSIHFEESTHPDFEVAVRYWLPGVRYRPARIGACAVPMRVAQPIDFKIPPPRLLPYRTP